jgi:CubicO group peptidase (beta-lactamase class C family)
MRQNAPMGMTRRALLGVVGATAFAAGCGDASPGPPVARVSSQPSPQPPTVRFDAATVTERVTAELTRFLSRTPENPQHPTYAGAVALVTIAGEPVLHVAVGDALRYGAGPVELPVSQRVPMREDAIFDLASITKVYTALLLLQQIDRGHVTLDTPVVSVLPEFAGPGKAAVTVRMLLTHTSGLPVGATLSGSTAAARRASVLATPLISGTTPGTVYRYSSVGLMIAAYLVEKVTGQGFDEALRTGLLEPLGLRETGFLPPRWLEPSVLRARVAATDARSSRGLLRGVVHDDVANRLGGIAGHAGIFSTAKDVAAIGHLLLNGGALGGTRILAEQTVRDMLTNANAGLPAVDPDRPQRSADHGLGVVLNQPWLMGNLSTVDTFGHTGFTGTSLVVHPPAQLVLVLLTNRAHPNWSWANPDPVRVSIANLVAGGLSRS